MCQKREIKGNKEKRERKSNGRIKKKNENLKRMRVEQIGEFGGNRIRKKKGRKKINKNKSKRKKKEKRK